MARKKKRVKNLQHATVYWYNPANYSTGHANETLARQECSNPIAMTAAQAAIEKMKLEKNKS